MHAFRRLRYLGWTLCIAVFQMALPLFAYAKMASDGGLTQEVCSPSGARKVIVDADGNAREVAPDSGQRDHCPLCTPAGTMPIAALIHLHESARNPGIVHVGQTCFQAGAAVSTPPATGPPSGS